MELLIVIIVLALVFDYINGFHDAANSIATIVSTKVLTPFTAVLWAAFFNFVAFFIAKFVIGEFGIANTVSKSLSRCPSFSPDCWLPSDGTFSPGGKASPSSSSHTLIGGFAGAAIAYGGFDAVHLGVVLEIAAFILLAPLIGMAVATILTIAIMHICKRVRPHRAECWFRRLQLLSSGLFSIGHGLNDSQKVMGIIAAALFVSGGREESITDIPTWVPLACFTMIALGTMSGGWRIVKTMGTKITKVTPLEGFVAETAGALTLYLTEYLHVPVSTTHTITGAIIGVGAVKRISAVRWGITVNLLWAWIITIPASSLFAAGIYWLIGMWL